MPGRRDLIARTLALLLTAGALSAVMGCARADQPAAVDRSRRRPRRAHRPRRRVRPRPRPRRLPRRLPAAARPELPRAATPQVTSRSSARRTPARWTPSSRPSSPSSIGSASRATTTSTASVTDSSSTLVGEGCESAVDRRGVRMELWYLPTVRAGLWPCVGIALLVFIPVSIWHERAWRRTLAEYGRARAAAGATDPWPPEGMAMFIGVQPWLVLTVAALLAGMTALGIGALWVWPRALPFFDGPLNYFDRPYVASMVVAGAAAVVGAVGAGHRSRAVAVGAGRAQGAPLHARAPGEARAAVCRGDRGRSGRRACTGGCGQRRRAGGCSLARAARRAARGTAGSAV